MFRVHVCFSGPYKAYRQGGGPRLCVCVCVCACVCVCVFSLPVLMTRVSLTQQYMTCCHNGELRVD